MRGGGLVEDVRKGNTYWQPDNYPWITPGFDHELAIPRQQGVGRESGGCSNEEAIANGIVQVNAPLNEGTKKAPPGGEAGRLLFPAGCLSVPAVDTEDEANEVSAWPRPMRAKRVLVR